MPEELAVVLVVLAGLGGLVSAVYYGARLSDWLSERFRHVSVRVLSRGIGTYDEPGYDMLTVELRLYNPKATPRRVAQVTLDGGVFGVGLNPVKTAYRPTGTGWRFEDYASVELPPKQHREVTLARRVKIGSKVLEEPRQVWATVRLDDGDTVTSKRFDTYFDWWRV